jgi:multimeric flavodoxin WrbA
MQVPEKEEILQNYANVVEGAMDNGADVEYINLYSYDFKGCMSCFACHLKKNK